MRAPDQQTGNGRAWNLDLTRIPEGQKHATVASWLVNVPGAHPFWAYWTITVVTLKDLPGVPPAKKRYPEAEYEFMILAIDPERCPEPDPDKIIIEGYPHLSPIDVIEQFHGISEADAGRLVDGAVRAVLSGHVSPDQDFRPAWRNLIAGTVQHFIEGKHPLN
jgi:hypothetical protein